MKSLQDDVVFYKASEKSLKYEIAAAKTESNEFGPMLMMYV